MDVALACSFSSPDSVCSLEGTGSQIVPLLACKLDVNAHLLSLGVSSGQQQDSTVSEVDLILNRAGHFVVTNDEKLSMIICPRHRKKLTTDWPGRKSSTCSYPSHRGPRKSMKMPRRVNQTMSEEIYQIHHGIVPIGSAVCSTCRGAHYKSREIGSSVSLLAQEPDPDDVALGLGDDMQDSDSETVSIVAVYEESTGPATACEGVVSTGEESETVSLPSISSQASIPEEEISVWVDEMEEQNDKRQKLNEAVYSISGGRYSPVMSTLNTTWDDVSDTQQRYYIRKAKETVTASLSVIAPGQEELVWKALQMERSLDADRNNQGKRKRFDPKSGLVESLIKAYGQAGHWQTKRQILSLFADDFSRAELQDMIPGLSKWRIDQARQHATEVGKGQPLPEIPSFRTKIGHEKVDHFIEYISRPEFLQDVAFGTKTLKLDSGEKIIIPAVIRTVIPSRIITQYLNYCKEQEFEPPSERSLYRMIEVCSASMQKSLQGLDNTSAEGSEAFDQVSSMLEGFTDPGINIPATQKLLKDGKRYLKNDFKTHIGRDEQCSDHCMVHALSDSTSADFRGECNHQNSYECERCESLEGVFEELAEMLDKVDMMEEERAMLKFEYTESVRKIKAWKAHLLRSSNQEEAKQNALQKLDETSCLVIMDWAMKFLPVQYREQMSDFFGKRGKSWHISAVITRETAKSKHSVECYVHIFNNCLQNSFAVLSIVEDLLHKVKQEYPLVTKAYLRSDNAGCYHNGPLLLSLREVGERTGVRPVRYDFSEPQAGKDICDRKTAAMKAHMKRWVNEKHDVVTAEDMKAALESHGGIKGCRAAVVDVDTTREKNQDSKIPGISVLNNFQYDECGIRVWKAYNIGPGRLITYNDFGAALQGDTGLKVIETFGQPTQKGNVGESVRQKFDIYSCQETGCVMTFKTQAEADDHMDTGKHRLDVDRESTYDRIRRRWAEMVTGVTFAPDVPSTSLQGGDSGITTRPLGTRPLGWALKVAKRPNRMTDNVKAFLIKKFDEGVRTGNKADPVQVAKEMKMLRNQDGQLTFKPEEWRNPQQISSMFSRHAAAQRYRGIAPEEITDEDIDAAVSVMALDSLKGLVMEDMERQGHPIIASGNNICDLVQTNKIGSLKLAVLKEICKDLNLLTSGPLSRKKTFIEAIKAFFQKLHML
ncbi:hypothetical protein ACROYT_G011171 [Oculina patagonica]